MAIYVGIELDAHSVRAAVVRTQLRRVQIVRYLELPIPPPELMTPEDPGEGASRAPTGVAAVVADVLKAAGPGAELIASIDSETLSLRRVELPASAAKKVDELLPFEVESLIPFETESTLLDYQLIETGDASALRLFVCAAPRDRIVTRLASLEAAGVDPLELVPSAPALAGLASFLPALVTDAPQMIVHAMAERLDVAILAKGRVELARTVSVGTQAIHDAGFAAPSYGTDTERLARELKQSIAAYRLQGGADPSGVWVVGAVDPSGMLLPWLAGVLERPVELLQLPEVFAANPKQPEPQLDPLLRARFGLALGLVGHTLGLPGKGRARHLDLRKGDFVRKRTVGLARLLAPLVAAALAAVFLSWGFSVYAQYTVLKARREVLESELARVSRTYLGEETRSASDARELLEAGHTNPDPMPQWTALDALIEISRAIPESLQHDVQRLQIDLAEDRSEGHFELQGTVASIDDTNVVQDALSHIECFQNLQQSGATTAAADGRRQYRLEADLRCPNETRGSDENRRGRRRSSSRSSGGAESSSQGGQ